jgi:hypothetical protein
MGKIIFNEADHTYEQDGVKLDSVTTLIQSLCKPFDKETISKKVASNDGKSQAEVLEEWERKGEEARDRGTMVHSYVDDVLSARNDYVMESINIKIPEMVAFDYAWGAMQSKLDAKIDKREFIVGSKELRVAGRVDALVSINIQSVRMKCIFDWKTGKFRTYNHFQTLLAPFDDQDDCELVKYSLQTSLYRLLMEQEPETTYGHAYLAHLRNDGSHMIHRAIDFRDRLTQWLLNR